MTIQEYKKRRKAKDKEDMRYYRQELLYWIKLIPIAVFGYIVIWLIGAVL